MSERRALYREWAELSLSRNDYPSAIQQYKRADDEAAADEVRCVYGDILADQERYEEAAAQWEAASAVPGREGRIRQLYALWAKQLYDREDYREAYRKASRADREELEEAGVSRFDILIRLGQKSLEEKNYDEALQACSNAEEEADTPDRLKDIEQLRVLVSEAKGQDAINAWLEAGADPAGLDPLRKAGKQFRDPDHQLRYWRLLADEGIDVTAVYPDGVTVDWDRPLPAECVAEESAVFDNARPLVLWREEKGYRLSMLDFILNSYSDHDSDDRSNYTITMMPSAWQALPAERRPGSLDECTCVLWADLTYQPAGKVYGTVRYPMTVPAGNKNSVTMPRSATVNRFLPKYTAITKIFCLDLKQNVSGILADRFDTGSYGGIVMGSVLEWKDSLSSISLSEAGLSGQFDRIWAWEKLAQAIGDGSGSGIQIGEKANAGS